MKVCKLEVLVIDEDMGFLHHVVDAINQIEYDNSDISTLVVNSSLCVEIGRWEDSPLSCYKTITNEMNRLFPKETV